jgi:hypothetical protein
VLKYNTIIRKGSSVTIPRMILLPLVIVPFF